MTRKLSDEDCLEIYKRLQNGETEKELAKKYNVAPSTISNAKQRALYLMIWQPLTVDENTTIPMCLLNRKKLNHLK
jgi:hypothetical protein